MNFGVGGYSVPVIFCIVGALPFLLLGIITVYTRYWIVSAWCAVVVVAFVDWGRCLLLQKRGTARKRPYGAKGASYVAVALAFLSLYAVTFIPAALQVREKVKFDKVVRWLTAVDDAEYHSLLASGRYSSSVLPQAEGLKPLEDFSIDVSLSTGAPAAWTATVHRKPLYFDSCPIFDCYTVTYRSLADAKRPREGFPGIFTCSNSGCTQSLLP